MSSVWVAGAIIAALTLSGCEGAETPATAPAKTSEPYLWEGQTRTLDKARAVEDLLRAGAARRQRTMAAQGG